MIERTTLYELAATAVPAPEPVLPDSTGLRVGWASVDLTPDRPVVIIGQNYARVMEGVADPVTATALALESSVGEGAVLVGCDLAIIPDELVESGFRERVRSMFCDGISGDARPELILNATHTHSGPDVFPPWPGALRLGIDIPPAWSRWGIELDAMTPPDYTEFAARRIASAAVEAWEKRQPGGISYGLSHAVVGHNRIMAYGDGGSRMYGRTDGSDFTHVEGWEDHSTQLLYTWDRESCLTGVLINIAATSQHDQSSFALSADYWHDVRVELRERLGAKLYILPQCSAAGDQTERVMIHKRAEQRMEKITGNDRRRTVAKRIADATTDILPYMAGHIDWNPLFAQRREIVNLQRRFISSDLYEAMRADLPGRKAEFMRLRENIENQPAIRNQDRWYKTITQAYSRLRGAARIIERYQNQENEPALPVEIYVLRLGDIVFAANPFELYLDFGIRIQERSPAVQTLIMQLAGSGNYVAPERSAKRGAYGATFSSNDIGARGGHELVEHTLELIATLWNTGRETSRKLDRP